ncbi:MAG: SpoIIE family protein phosphatase [Lachnospiraceae bacterium]|nr:SpoIIE family protein phosphatase [Lachnospiraceae bacterium]
MNSSAAKNEMTKGETIKKRNLFKRKKEDRNKSMMGRIFENPKTLRILLLNIIGIALSGIRINGLNPVGLGYFAALSMAGNSPVASIVAFVGGMSGSFGMVDLLKNAAILSATLILFKILTIGKMKLGDHAAALLIGGMALLMEIMDYIMSNPLRGSYRQFVSNMMIMTSLSILSGLLCIIFKKAADSLIIGKRIFSNDEMMGFAIMAGVFLYNTYTNPVIQPVYAAIMAFFIVLYAAYKHGIGMGALMGMACGIPLSIWNRETDYLSMICIMGILVGLFRELGKFASAATMLMVGSISFYSAFQEVASQNSMNDMMKGMLGAAVIFLMLPKSIIYRYEDNENENKEENVKMLFEERLMNIARIFEQLSKSVFGGNNMKEVYEIENGMLKSMSQGNYVFHQDEMERQIWNNRIHESKAMMSEQLEQISKVIEDYSKQIYNFVKITQEQEEYIRHRMKLKKVNLDKIVGLESTKNRKEYLVTAKCDRRFTVGSREIAQILSETFGKKYVPSKNCRKLISTEYTTTTYVEETNFTVRHASAKKARGDSGISGDNFSLKELENGHLLMGLSDGMGYGASACIESETVIELLEQLLDSGFDAECALKMINSVMVMNSAEDHPATLDYGVIDLHSGVCDIVKIGAAATFVKRGNWVETIKSTTMPLGIFSKVDYDSTRKKLYDGDVVIMVSDGVIDAIESENKDEELGKIISNIHDCSPKQMAEAILQCAIGGKTRLSDDMTVLVTEIWENERKAA